MVNRKTVKINLDNYEKLMDLKELKGYTSLNETIENLFPLGTVHDVDYQQEQPAFEISDNKVSWNTLKNSEINTTWKSNDESESAVVMFKLNVLKSNIRNVYRKKNYGKKINYNKKYYNYKMRYRQVAEKEKEDKIKRYSHTYFQRYVFNDYWVARENYQKMMLQRSIKRENYDYGVKI